MSSEMDSSINRHVHGNQTTDAPTLWKPRRPPLLRIKKCVCGNSLSGSDEEGCGLDDDTLIPEHEFL